MSGSRELGAAPRRSIWTRSVDRWLLPAVVVTGVVVAVAAHLWPLTTDAGGLPLDCGSLADRPLQLSPLDQLECAIGFDSRETWRRLGLIVAVVAGLMVIGKGVRRRASAVRQVAWVDGDTTVRWARPSDDRDISDTIDAIVMQEMGWRETDRSTIVQAVSLGPDSGMLAITETGGDVVVGVISAVGDTASVGVRIGMWTGPAHRGRGHMRRAVQLVAGHFGGRGMHLYAETGVHNVAVQACLERAGFERIGQRRVRLPNDTEVDGLIYARYATEPVTSATG